MDFEKYLDENLPKHARLTSSVENIIKSLLEQSGIEYLSVSGRTKTKSGIAEKIKRKNYKYPEIEMTDISGVRIILFVESDIEKVGDIIETAFRVDFENSSNKDEFLSSDQVGYRSVHFVCDLGKQRAKLPEFDGLEKLKFEFQIRTVLQHAWAEMAHGTYKFRGELPGDIQRKLYLHAGLLEIADKGFSEIAKEIDQYTNKVNASYQEGDLKVELNAISLTEFIDSWSEENDYNLSEISSQSQVQIAELIREIKAFGISTIEEFDKIIPKDFAERLKHLRYDTNVFGFVRTILIINDVTKIMSQNVNWNIFDPDDYDADMQLYKHFSSAENFQKIVARLKMEMYEDEDQVDISDEYYDDHR